MCLPPSICSTTQQCSEPRTLRRSGLCRCPDCAGLSRVWQKVEAHTFTARCLLLHATHVYVIVGLAQGSAGVLRSCVYAAGRNLLPLCVLQLWQSSG
jgi:hypothetical protein